MVVDGREKSPLKTNNEGVAMKSKILQKLLREQMRYGQEFAFTGMEAKYNTIMNEGKLAELKKMSIETFHRRLNEWSNVHDGWLQKKGEGKNAVFFKREPRFSSLYEKAKRILTRPLRFRHNYAV